MTARRKAAPARRGKKKSKAHARKRGAAAAGADRKKRTAGAASRERRRAAELIDSSCPAEPRGATSPVTVLRCEPVRAGVVRRYFPRARAALVAVEAPLRAGDLIHVRGATSDFVARIESLRSGGIACAGVGAGEATLGLPERARAGDLVFALRSDG
jgi:hypothetical protein